MFGKSLLLSLVAGLALAPALSGAAQAQIKAEHPRNCVMNEIGRAHV